MDSGKAFRRTRNLDHQVVAIDRAPQALSFGDRGFGVHRKIGRDLDADKTVGAACGIEGRAQHVGCFLDIFDRELFENLGGRSIVRLQHALDGVVVFVGMADGLLKNRRVRRDAAQAVVIDEFFQAAFGDEAARQEIEPHRLTMILQ